MSIESYFIVIAIFIIYFIALALRKYIKWKDYCPICASVSIAWITLLFGYYFGLYQNKAMLGMLMGMSATGWYYLLDKKWSENEHIFRLPLLLSLAFVPMVALGLYEGISDLVYSSIILLLIWGFFAFLYKKDVNRALSPNQQLSGLNTKQMPIGRTPTPIDIMEQMLKLQK